MPVQTQLYNYSSKLEISQQKNHFLSKSEAARWSRTVLSALIVFHSFTGVIKVNVID